MEKKYKSKILLFTSTNFPHEGGLSTHMEMLGKGLKEIGAEAEYYSISKGTSYMIKILSLPVYPLKFINKSFLIVRSVLFSEIALSFGIFFKQLFNRYAVINAQHHVALNSCYFVKKVFKTPLVLTVHHYLSLGSEEDLYESNSFVKKFLAMEEKKAYKLADKLVAVDSRIRDYIIKSFGVEENKMAILINSIDTSDYKPRENKKELGRKFNLPDKKLIILCPRRLVKKNGVIYAAEAAKHLKNIMGEDFILVFAGDGPEVESIKELVRKNDLSENVMLLGNVKHEEIKYLYNASDAVLIPSVNYKGVEEATSLSALEAMASGIPVIASSIGGLKELITDKETGFLVEEKDARAIAKKILQLSKQDNSDLINKARRFVVQKCSHIKRAKDFMKVYEEVLAKK